MAMCDNDRNDAFNNVYHIIFAQDPLNTIGDYEIGRATLFL